MIHLGIYRIVPPTCFCLRSENHKYRLNNFVMDAHDLLSDPGISRHVRSLSEEFQICIWVVDFNVQRLKTN